MAQPSQRMKKSTVIMGSFVHSLSIDQLEVIDRNGLMIINHSGKIVCLESSIDPWTKVKLQEKLTLCLGEDFNDQHDLQNRVRLIALRGGEFFLPGFIDTHTHAVQYQNIGVGQQYELLDWLKHVTYAEEIKFEDENYAKRMFEKVVTRLIRVGTTTCCYYSSLHLSAAKILAKVCSHSGQRAFIGKCNMDRNHSVDQYKEPSAEQSLQESIQLIEFLRNGCQNSLQNSFEELENHPKNKCCIATASLSPNYEDLSIQSIVQPILTPRFAISCTDELLRKLGELMNTDDTLRLQTHLSESCSEIEFTKALFPNCSNYSKVYDSFGLLTERTILAHCIHLEPDELNLLIERKCGISHCPTSNFNLSSGVCQIRSLLESGFEKVSLGTDVSGGYGVSILSSIRDAAAAAKTHGFGKHKESSQDHQLSIENLVYMATLGGARVCNLDDRIGNFQLGKEFDGLLIQTEAGSGIETRMNQNREEADENDDDFKNWILASQSECYVDGSNPNFFTDGTSDDIDLLRLLEKFLFTGDDRNIGSVFINSRIVGGSRPLKHSF